MIKPGMFISERYEIIDKVGSGGMADVYKAKCHRLNRFVAIKVLKSEFSTDKNFVQKFRAEAQSVAGFSHPNIVSVYDVGDDDGLHYIVMELVEGITLKRYIDRKKQLDTKEAVGIAIQICQGMEAAHKHHIIHRDIKPQNIIISREGKVKVADFGIARAATSNTISQNAIGSVHYLSPEQARGGYSDERSDIYSLGVTLYEMLTGQVPFSGDNSVSVALLHIQSEATPVQVINPAVPTSVDRIVQKCMQKKPERRYQSAEELIFDLRRSIMHPDGEYVKLNNGVVADSPTRSITDEELSTIKNGGRAPAPQEHEDAPRAKSEDRPKERRKADKPHKPSKSAKPKKQLPKRVRRDDDELDEADSTTDRILTGICIFLAIAVMGVIVFLSWIFFVKNEAESFNKDPGTQNESTPTQQLILTQVPATPSPSPTPAGTIQGKVEMQRVIGLTRQDATSLLKAVSPDFEIVWYEDYSDEYKSGLVFWQYPAANTLAERNARVELYVSVGKEYKELPSVTGKSFDATERMLSAYGYIVLEYHEYSDTVSEGVVIRSDPAAGTPVTKNMEIKVYVSDGPENKPVAVPNICGLTEKKATQELETAELILGDRIDTYSDMYPAGVICGQSIELGTLVPEKTIIDYYMSIGPEPTN